MEFLGARKSELLFPPHATEKARGKPKAKLNAGVGLEVHCTGNDMKSRV